MKLIERLGEMIDDEIGDAMNYATMAVNYKWDRPELADVFFRISNEELGHMDLLHKQVVNVIEEYRREKGEPPADMMAVYEYLHKKRIEQVGKVRMMQAQYRG